MREPRSRVVVVTGASAGVGRAVARAFGARGDSVALLARGIDGLKAARREIESGGGQAIDLPLDVSDSPAVEKAASTAERELGPIDVWVNNAMLGVFAEFVDTEPEDFRRVTEVTYLGYVNGTRTALQQMLERDRGTIELRQALPAGASDLPARGRGPSDRVGLRAPPARGPRRDAHGPVDPA